MFLNTQNHQKYTETINSIDKYCMYEYAWH